MTTGLDTSTLGGADDEQSSEESLALSAHLEFWQGLYVVNGGYDGPSGEDAVRTGHADAVAYGRTFLANPDLPRRLELRAALNEPDPATFYGGGAAGYITYPALHHQLRTDHKIVSILQSQVGFEATLLRWLHKLRIRPL